MMHEESLGKCRILSLFVAHCRDICEKCHDIWTMPNGEFKLLQSCECHLMRPLCCAHGRELLKGCLRQLTILAENVTKQFPETFGFVILGGFVACSQLEVVLAIITISVASISTFNVKSFLVTVWPGW